MLVTGGSRGIGASTVLLAARQGWRVAFCWRSNAVAAQELVQQLAGWGHDTLAEQADVSDETQVQNLFDRVLQGPAQMLVGRRTMRFGLATELRDKIAVH